jgi:cysteine synthase A
LIFKRMLKKEVDEGLLQMFLERVKAKVPHLVDSDSTISIAQATPLIDLTDSLLDCAKTEYGLGLSSRTVKVFGKLDSALPSGSIKVRPAVLIIENAIRSGNLKRNQTIFEATSGNFGIALGLLQDLGLNVVVIVSRRLQEGVFSELKASNLKVIDLDIDICPAPGLRVEPDIAVAKGVASYVRSQLEQLGFDLSPFDHNVSDIEMLLARQDVIALAKCLAKIYDGFCPEQYDNELNVEAHRTVTGPEIDMQLRKLGYSISDYKIVCTFGTGGTSTGLGRYLLQKYSKKLVHVVFPLRNQDVAGIRTKDKAMGLKFYRPEIYAAEHEVDFEAAKPLLRYFVRNGYQIGESSALALYSVLQMVNFGVGESFVVILADGASKYVKSIELAEAPSVRLSVSFKDVVKEISQYTAVLWTHPNYVPNENGMMFLAEALGCERDKISVANPDDIKSMVSEGQIPKSFMSLLPTQVQKVLLVCVSGNNSLRVAGLLSSKGIGANSLDEGIVGISSLMGRDPSNFLRLPARAG